MKAIRVNPAVPTENTFSPWTLVTPLTLPQRPRFLDSSLSVLLTYALYAIKQFITENTSNDYYPKYNQDDAIQCKLIYSKLL